MSIQQLGLTEFAVALLMLLFIDVTSGESKDMCYGIITETKLQTIVSSHSTVEYKANITTDENSRWCFDGFSAYEADGLVVENDTAASLTNPMHFGFGLLYLVANSTSGGCCNVIGVHPISSHTGNISSAQGIWINIVEAIPCPEPPSVRNGSASVTILEPNGTYVERRNATYTCNTGYRLNGTDTIQCLRETDELMGTWCEEPPTCTPITCKIQNLTNGFVEYNTNETNGTVPYGTEAMYHCYSGFNLVGECNKQQRCVSNQNNTAGEWIGGTQPLHCNQSTMPTTQEPPANTTQQPSVGGDTAQKIREQVTSIVVPVVLVLALIIVIQFVAIVIIVMLWRRSTVKRGGDIPRRCSTAKNDYASSTESDHSSTT